jgi:hypothetical protein
MAQATPEQSARASLTWGIISLVLCITGAGLLQLATEVENLILRDWLEAVGGLAGVLSFSTSGPSIVLGIVGLARGTSKKGTAIVGLVLGGILPAILYLGAVAGVISNVLNLLRPARPHSPF